MKENIRTIKSKAQSELVERFRHALMVEHHHDWDMDTVAEAAYICAGVMMSSKEMVDLLTKLSQYKYVADPSVEPANRFLFLLKKIRLTKGKSAPLEWWAAFDIRDLIELFEFELNKQREALPNNQSPKLATNNDAKSVVGGGEDGK